MQDINKINEYFLKKKEQIIIDTDANDILSEKVNPNIVLGMLANLDTWGYTIDKDLLVKLFNLSEETFVHKFYEPLIQTLKEIKGDDVSHDNFLFKNFPDSCRNISHEELSAMRFLAYYTGVLDYYLDETLTSEIEWDGEKEDRKDPAPISSSRLRTIKEGSLKDFETMVNNLLRSRSALSPFEKEIVEFALNSEDIENAHIIPDTIPFKENWAYLFKYAFANPELQIPMEFKNFNDFIRSGVALSDGDISLSEKPKFRNFTRQERTQLMSMLESATKNHYKQMKESMMTPKNRRFVINVLYKGWHIKQSYKNMSPEFLKLTEEIQNEYSLRAMYEIAIKNEQYEQAAEMAGNISAGELARKANELLSKCPAEREENVLNIIIPRLKEVPIPILLNLNNTILKVNNSDIKVAFPKGMTAYAHAFENQRKYDCIQPSVKEKLTDAVNNAIEFQLSKNKRLGKVYIDKDLVNCPVPFSSRNANGENRCAERGTAISLKDDTNCIRAFCYKQIKDHPDFVDLSATFLDQNFNMLEQCSWTNLKTRNENVMAVHSGDNPNCKDGLTEFIDIDLSKLKEHAKEEGIKYVAFHVLSWGGVPFDKMDRCFFGVMERENPASDLVTENDLEKLKENGVNVDEINFNHPIYYFQLSKEQRDMIGYKQEKVFDPASVEFRNDIKSKGVANIPILYDVDNNRIIVADLEANRQNPFIYAKNNSKNLFQPYPDTLTVENLCGAAAQACYGIVNMEKPNMYELAMYNVRARQGEITDNIEEADTIFAVSKDHLPEIKEGAEIITIYDKDIITSNLMMSDPEKDEIIEEIEK